ncbi:MAG: hypothetical protein MI861_11645 [Pirellulales bacterium]|nr:hypothetical protein [Pirellulales bacterium]
MMNRYLAGTTALVLACWSQAMCSAEDPIVPADHTIVTSTPIFHPTGATPPRHCHQDDIWARVHGWLFRRYAGSVEMETKTEYPRNYFGRYTYRKWRPDWVKPRVSYSFAPQIASPQIVSPQIQSETSIIQPSRKLDPPHRISAPLQSVDVEPLQPQQ